MSTHTAISYHIVFSTKKRTPLRRERREDLFRCIWGIIKNRHSHLYRINGVEDHLHILSSLHPTVSLADFVKEVKTRSALCLHLIILTLMGRCPGVAPDYSYRSLSGSKRQGWPWPLHGLPRQPDLRCAEPELAWGVRLRTPPVLYSRD